MKKLLKNLFKNSLQKGFTLIELLVVIAVLGVLATIVLLAVNPGEQLARARDTSRIAAVTQLGRALQAYYTAAGGTFSGLTDGTGGTVATDWMTPLITSNDLKVRPANPNWGTPPVAGTTNCSTQWMATWTGAPGQNAGGYCYAKNGGATPANTDALVWARLESNLYNNKCTSPSIAYGIFSTKDARYGVVCQPTAADPAVGTQAFVSTP